MKVIFGSVLLSLGGSGISSMHPRPLLAALMRDMTSGSQAWQASKDVQLACMALLECCSLDLVSFCLIGMLCGCMCEREECAYTHVARMSAEANGLGAD